MQTLVQKVLTAVIILILKGVASFGNGKREEMVL
jgi:hypothetical protein